MPRTNHGVDDICGSLPTENAYAMLSCDFDAYGIVYAILADSMNMVIFVA